MIHIMSYTVSIVIIGGLYLLKVHTLPPADVRLWYKYLQPHQGSNQAPHIGRSDFEAERGRVLKMGHRAIEQMGRQRHRQVSLLHSSHTPPPPPHLMHDLVELRHSGPQHVSVVLEGGEQGTAPVELHIGRDCQHLERAGVALRHAHVAAQRDAVGVMGGQLGLSTGGGLLLSALGFRVGGCSILRFHTSFGSLLQAQAAGSRGCLGPLLRA